MRESFGIRIEADPIGRIWSGHGDLVIPADIVEVAPATYVGGGDLISAPDFQQLINGEAERLDIRMSGVSDLALELAIEAAASVKGARVHFVRFDFDDEWQLEEVEYEACYRADRLSVSSSWSDDGRQRFITLSIASDDTNRSRAPLAYFTDQDQRRRSADDAIFSHVAGITQGTTRRFGAK